jgi:CDP-diacylglycerol--serine O-phosphatidyltransferase
VLVIAFLLVSRLPVFSGKKIGARVPREMVLPVIVAVILVIALLIGYPWHVLSAGTLLFLCSLPVGYMSYREHERRAAEAAAAAAATATGQLPRHSDPIPPPTPDTTQNDRPPRLN